MISTHTSRTSENHVFCRIRRDKELRWAARSDLTVAAAKKVGGDCCYQKPLNTRAQFILPTSFHADSMSSILVVSRSCVRRFTYFSTLQGQAFIEACAQQRYDLLPRTSPLRRDLSQRSSSIELHMKQARFGLQALFLNSSRTTRAGADLSTLLQ